MLCTDRLLAPHDVQQHVDLVARIDQERLSCAFTGDDEAVFLEGGYCASLEEHRYSIHAASAPSRASTPITAITTLLRLRWVRRRAGSIVAAASAASVRVSRIAATLRSSAAIVAALCDRCSTLAASIRPDNLFELRRDRAIETAEHEPRALAVCR